MRCVNNLINVVRVPVGSLKLDHHTLIRKINHPVLTIPALTVRVTGVVVFSLARRRSPKQVGRGSWYHHAGTCSWPGSVDRYLLFQRTKISDLLPSSVINIPYDL